MAKLTFEQKQEIRTLYATGNFTQCQLAERFGVRQNTISLTISQQPRTCVDCGTPLVNKQRCEDCGKAHSKAYVKQWQDTHKEQRAALRRGYWRANEGLRDRHRVQARESARRCYVPKEKRGVA